MSQWKKKGNIVMKAINSFHVNKGFGSDKNRDIGLLDNSQIILRQ